MNNLYQENKPVKCNWCEWIGTELNLIVHADGDACPKCKRRGHLMDMPKIEQEEN